jgi:hypothetical protein
MQPCEAGFAVPRGLYFVAIVIEDAGQRLADARLIIHYKHARTFHALVSTV